jgi:hypothetical protein
MKTRIPPRVKRGRATWLPRSTSYRSGNRERRAAPLKPMQWMMLVTVEVCSGAARPRSVSKEQTAILCVSAQRKHRTELHFLYIGRRSRPRTGRFPEKGEGQSLAQAVGAMVAQASEFRIIAGVG